MDFRIFIFLAGAATSLVVATLVTKRYGLGMMALPFCLTMVFAPFIATFEDTKVLEGQILNSGLADENGNVFTVVRAINSSYPYKAAIVVLTNPNANITVVHEKKYFDFTTAMVISSIYTFHVILILLQFWANVSESTERALSTGRWGE